MMDRFDIGKRILAPAHMQNVRQTQLSGLLNQSTVTFQKPPPFLYSITEVHVTQSDPKKLLQ